MKRMPQRGADVEIFGVLTTFIAGANMSDGDVQFTVRACASNVRLIKTKAEASGKICVVVGTEIVQISALVCTWRNCTAGALYDEDMMLGQTDDHLKASIDARGFQRLLSRRNRV
ncbi:hypothetical protein [Pseudomonas baetica]|uniref:hypothetical protein n=1 Tax=Pseudomonas baetica TaxID=674054 RepID=UPI002406A722|nr:hypothetical protein [Pseudomonas baetica]MDF9779166.1 hypothetical protein [Pseudomonas baetica]